MPCFTTHLSWFAKSSDSSSSQSSSHCFLSSSSSSFASHSAQKNHHIKASNAQEKKKERISSKISRTGLKLLKLVILLDHLCVLLFLFRVVGHCWCHHAGVFFCCWSRHSFTRKKLQKQFKTDQGRNNAVVGTPWDTQKLDHLDLSYGTLLDFSTNTILYKTTKISACFWKKRPTCVMLNQKSHFIYSIYFYSLWHSPGIITLNTINT